mmetsp:Transcript_452/g.870  ORF Transcript_452/g.870 Transcript_452/m.870 type:complete len:127 (-) Transcript_452:659-1039(-)
MKMVEVIVEIDAIYIDKLHNKTHYSAKFPDETIEQISGDELSSILEYSRQVKTSSNDGNGHTEPFSNDNHRHCHPPRAQADSSSRQKERNRMGSKGRCERRPSDLFLKGLVKTIRGLLLLLSPIIF